MREEAMKLSRFFLPGPYSFPLFLTFVHVMDSSFSQFLAVLQKNLETNDASFESPIIVLLESGKKLGMASP